MECYVKVIILSHIYLLLFRKLILNMKYEKCIDTYRQLYIIAKLSMTND